MATYEMNIQSQLTGLQCSSCFRPFVAEHGHPVLCTSCWGLEAKGKAHRIRGTLPTEIAGCTKATNREARR